MTAKQPAYTSIVASFGWPYSVSQLVDGFKVMGYSITPLERPEGGFDHRQSALLQALDPQQNRKGASHGIA